MKNATCLLVMGLTFLLGSGCIEISKMLTPPPPADETETIASDNTQANDTTASDNDAASDSQSADADSNGDSDVADDADTSGLDDVDATNLDETDTNGADDASTNGADDINSNGSDDAEATEGGVPPLPDGADLTTTGSGLQFFDFELGGGGIPEVTSTVRVAYTGYLEDGTIFDSNENATFNLSSLIEGFSEGVRTMNVGGRRRLLIPPDLGYGAGGNAGAGIGGEDTIIFDVELLAIEEL